MAIDYVAGNGRRRPVPRGWIIVVLALAAWGLFSIIALGAWALCLLLVSLVT